MTDWKTWKPSLLATLMFIIDESRGEVLLIRKKRGLGAGKINGPGGKIDPGETFLQCAIRETQEELGVTALDPVKHGELWFQFVDGLSLHVDVFVATQHEGIAVETAEAVPLWTPLHALPLHEMWADDRFWLEEMLLRRRHFIGRFTFDDDTMLTDEMEWL
ncbi:MAG: 8-oxo-dGTP diphosphatase [Verrucomicrobiaceae bacterium]|nr:8-oxo-dGTP diphosphatase [Verrucomicrobiaceae bacterium]